MPISDSSRNRDPSPAPVEVPYISRRRWTLFLAALLAGAVGFGGTWAAFCYRCDADSQTDPLLAPGFGEIGPSAGLPDAEYNKPTGTAAGG